MRLILAVSFDCISRFYIYQSHLRLRTSICGFCRSKGRGGKERLCYNLPCTGGVTVPVLIALPRGLLNYRGSSR